MRYRRTVLAPARWLLSTDHLPAPSATMHHWEAALETQRQRLRIPARVLLVDDDQRLPLDLDHPLHRHLLRRSLNAAHHLELREAPTRDAVAWLGRSHELLLPLRLNSPATPPRSSTSLRPVAADTGHLPGRSSALAANLGAHPARYDEILTRYFPALVASLPQPTTWWFQRHREMTRPDAEQHLTLYLLLPDPDAYGPAADQIHGWSAGLRRKRLLATLSLSTYQSQTGRYGHEDAMDAAHDVFAADSAAALAQIRMADNTAVQAQALAAASMVDLAARLAGSPEQGFGWLVQHLPQQHGPLDPLLRDQALHLADQLEPSTSAAGALPGWDQVVSAWCTRAAALDTYRDQLADQRNPMSVLRSLLHEHHARALSVDPDDERATNRLVRACALRGISTGEQPMTAQADLVRHFTEVLKRPDTPPPDEAWQAHSLAQGSAGTALLHIQLAHMGHGTWQQAHTWIKSASGSEISAADNTGLFLGAPAIAFLLQTASGSPAHYEQHLAALDGHVADLAERRSLAAMTRISRGELPTFAEYDIFYGLTGIGAHLLRRDPGSSALEKVLTYLVALTTPLRISGEEVPGWWVAHDPHGRPCDRGHGNLGAAHGVTGILMLLSQAARRRITVKGQHAAIASLCSWLNSWKQDSGGRPWWPETLSLDELRTHTTHQSGPGRPSWCYGTPASPAPASWPPSPWATTRFGRASRTPSSPACRTRPS